VSEERVLVVVTEDVDSDVLREELSSTVAEDAEVRVVASPSLSFTEWLTNDEDEARAEAANLAEAGAEAAESDEAEAEVGDPDPVQAIEDALHSFDADEILLVRSPKNADDLEPALEHLGLPVRSVWLGEPRRTQG
jgi:hypothetical protein